MKKIFLALVILFQFANIQADVVRKGTKFIDVQFVNLDSFPGYRFYVRYRSLFGERNWLSQKDELTNNKVDYVGKRRYIPQLIAVSKQDTTKMIYCADDIPTSEVHEKSAIKNMIDVYRIKSLNDSLKIEKIHRIYQYNDGKEEIKKNEIFPTGNMDWRNQLKYFALPLLSLLLLTIFFFHRKYRYSI